MKIEKKHKVIKFVKFSVTMSLLFTESLDNGYGLVMRIIRITVLKTQRDKELLKKINFSNLNYHIHNEDY